MGHVDSLRLLCASLAATAVLAFALGAATTLWLLSPHLPTSAATPPPGMPAVPVSGLAVSAAQAAAPPAAPPAIPPPPGAQAQDTAGAPGQAAPQSATQSTLGAPPPSASAAPPPAASSAPPPAAAAPAAVAPAPAGGKAAAAAAPPPMPPRALSDNRGQTYQVHLGTFRDAATAERLATCLLYTSPSPRD